MKAFLLLLLPALILFNNSYSQIWDSLGSGMNATVFALTVYNNQLIAGGYFTTAGGVNANYIAKWNGTDWAPLGSGMNSNVYSLTVYNNELIAGGEFTTAGGMTANYIAKWNGTAWAPLGNGMNSSVFALSVYNNQLIAGGYFTTAGGVNANYIAKWNGTDWAPLGSGMSYFVHTLTVYNNQLIAGGRFTTAGGVTANRIAKWNDTTWAPLGSGMNSWVNALTVYNNELIAGGDFSTAGGTLVNAIAKWNGSDWAPLGSGINGIVYALTVYNNQLIAGGAFYTAGGVSANRIARWYLPPPAQAPNLIAPPNNSQGQPLTPLLDWDTIANATSFSAQISTDSLFTSATFDTTVLVTQVTVPPGKLINNTKYYWRVRGVNAGGNGPWSVIWNFRTALVGINKNDNERPKEFKLFNNYPNPFNPATKIQFALPHKSFTKLIIYDCLGREVTALVNELLNAGSYEVDFNGSNLSSGVYYYKLTAGNFTQTKKMILLK